ncbi:hypothetical protein MUK42_02880 [Musa troglodytarum]|uniref:Uncharacterized protein n=1 Tax=Musa troglodytarum TaxID=320322 RepID=A0A9E7EU75_9LILI|nr:hypothetical protein MUK42_02880 [Musa troglodytarum]URD81920.1 hypothetical protein MUK42_02880 [Musa troglodytarum]
MLRPPFRGRNGAAQMFAHSALMEVPLQCLRLHNPSMSEVAEVNKSTLGAFAFTDAELPCFVEKNSEGGGAEDAVLREEHGGGRRWEQRGLKRSNFSEALRTFRASSLLVPCCCRFSITGRTLTEC